MSKARLVYSDDISTSSYRLMEIPTDILADFKINPNKLLVIKGYPEEEAVLCTDTQTYSVRLAMSSNTFLLVPPSTSKTDSGDEVLSSVASVSSHYELTKIAPRLHTLTRILESTPYRGEGEEEEAIDKSKLYTFQKLSQVVQASEEELRAKLREFDALQLNGFWRMLHSDFLTTTLDLLLTNVEAKGWSLENLDGQALINEMSEYNPVVLQHILGSYGSRIASSHSHWCLDLKKLSIFRATQLLRELLGDKNTIMAKNKSSDIRIAGTGKDWRLADFTTTWQESVPIGAPVEVGLLAGIAVTVLIGTDAYVRYLPASDVKNIPDPRDRIRLLFSVRPRWKLEELEPYLNDVAPTKQTLEQLLVKTARPVVQQDNIRVYCSRE